MRVLELNHVAVHVEDVERSERFYAEVLGLPPLPRPAFDFPGAWFRVGTSQEVHLIGGAGPDPARSSPRGNHFALRVDSISAAEERLRQAGVEYGGPRTRPDGALQIFLRDPDGHVVELFTPP